MNEGMTEPRFVTVQTVAHRFRGPRPNGLEGAVVHYDAGRAGGSDPDRGARATLAGGAADGYAFATIGRGGTIFLPGNMDWSRWGSHAGESRCPATGRTGVSRFYVGFEINSPGRVYPTADPDIFVPWFEAVTEGGRVVLDAQGRGKAKAGAREIYRAGELRHLAAAQGNIRAGAYVPFTAAQMEALTAVLLWLRRRFPESFRLDRVFGHDEVAPARKTDPGGALGHGDAALTMAAYREELAALA